MKILLIRLRLIGDVVFTTPAITALRRHFPAASITYLVERAAEPVVRHNQHLTEVVVAEPPAGAATIDLRPRLGMAPATRQRFDLVIDFHGGPRSAWLTRATGAAERIGYNLPGRAWAYTIRLPWTRALVPPRHSVESQWDLLVPLLGVAPPDPTGRRSKCPRMRSLHDAVRQRLSDAGVDEKAQRSS